MKSIYSSGWVPHQLGDTYLPFEAVIHSAIGTACRKRDDRAAMPPSTIPYYLFSFLSCYVVLARPGVTQDRHLVFILVTSFVWVFLRIDTRYKVCVRGCWWFAEHKERKSQPPSITQGDVV